MPRDDRPTEYSVPVGHEQDTDRSDPGARRGARWRMAAIVLAVLAVLWWFLGAGAVSESYAGLGADLPVGEGLLVGHPGFIEQDLDVLAVRPVASPGLDIEFLICEEGEGGDSAIGAVPEADASQYCASLQPVDLGTGLRANPPAGDSRDYLVVLLRPTDEGPQWMCGFDIAYRSGWRFGWQRGVGMRVVLNGTTDELMDDHCA